MIFCDAKALKKKFGRDGKVPSGLTEKQAEELHATWVKEEERFEIATFDKIRAMILKMLTRDGLSKKNKMKNLNSVNLILLQSRSELDAKILSIAQRKT